jgi:hypothetical protein
MGGVERKKYSRHEQFRQQAEAEAAEAHRAHEQQLQRFVAPTSNSYGGPSQMNINNCAVPKDNAPLSSLVPHSDYAPPNYLSRPGAMPNLPTSTLSRYGPGGPRSESGSSSCSSRFTPVQSISGYDGPKDARPSQANVGNLELGARIWFTTRGVSFPKLNPRHVARRSCTLLITTSKHLPLLLVTSATSHSLRDGHARS